MVVTNKTSEQIQLEDGTDVSFLMGQHENLVIVYRQQEERPLYLSKKDLEDMLELLEEKQ